MKNIQSYPLLKNRSIKPAKSIPSFTKKSRQDNKSQKIDVTVYKLIHNIKKTKSGQMKAIL